MIPSLLLLTALDARSPAIQIPPQISPGIVEVAWGVFGCFLHVEGTLTRPNGGEILHFVEQENGHTQVVRARLTPFGLETMEEFTYEGAGSTAGLMEDSSMISGYFQLSYRREGALPIQPGWEIAFLRGRHPGPVYRDGDGPDAAV